MSKKNVNFIFILVIAFTAISVVGLRYFMSKRIELVAPNTNLSLNDTNYKHQKTEEIASSTLNFILDENNKIYVYQDSFNLKNIVKMTTKAEVHTFFIKKKAEI